MLFLTLALSICCQAKENSRWKITDRQSILWDLSKETSLPHKDNIEMSGRKVSAIIFYEIDENKNLNIQRDLIFPQLRIFNKTNEADWKKYRAYFRKKVRDDLSPKINYKDKTITPSQVDSIEIGGMITFYFTPIMGLQITKTIYPSMEDRLIVENWSIKNLEQAPKDISISKCNFEIEETGYKGTYTFLAKNNGSESFILPFGKSKDIPIFYGALLNQEKATGFNAKQALEGRLEFLQNIKNKLHLITPNKVINTLYYFSKIRAAESIFDSSMGLIHSPGGGNYYCGIWANDQVEYSGPFFPHLGYQKGIEAAFNAYQMFLKNIPKDDSNIAYAFEMDGNFAMTHLDRGDAAMIAYGTSKYLLNLGDKNQAEKLWPLIKWSLEYCHNQRNEYGAIQSASDEMEGRIETGKANLSTSCLYYGGLKFSSILANDLGFIQDVTLLDERSKKMKIVIEDYFGATIEGLHTYKYFEENDKLRHWICLPLCMGLEGRKEETLKALFNKLWTENGVLVEYDPNNINEKQVFWDRATLYALRGALKSGDMTMPFDRLLAYSKTRLLGDHVPYAIEAFPENNMKHLSAESALYCRIFTEGLLGMEPIGLKKIKFKPSLPPAWNDVNLENISLCGFICDVKLKRTKGKLKVEIQRSGKLHFQKTIEDGEEFHVSF